MVRSSGEIRDISNRIRSIRKSLGLSMEDFAKKIDSKARSGTVSNWETGKNLPNNERLKRIAELGGISVEELLYGNQHDILKSIKKYVDEIMTKEIEEFGSEKYKMLYDSSLKTKIIAILHERYDYKGLSDFGFKQFVKQLLDTHLDKEMKERRYTPYSDKNAYAFTYDLLNKIEKNDIDTYFAKEEVDMLRKTGFLKENEIKEELSYEVYGHIKTLLNDVQKQLYNKY